MMIAFFLHHFFFLQYGLAEDMSRTGGAVNAKEISPNELYSQSAIYIAAAHALKPNYSVGHLYLKYMTPFISIVFLFVSKLVVMKRGRSGVGTLSKVRNAFSLIHAFPYNFFELIYY